MTLLTVWPDTDATTTIVRTDDPEVIASELASIGVDFRRWELQSLPDNASTDDILAAYADVISAYAAEQGFVTIDAVALSRTGTDAEWTATAAGARSKFLAEHTHDDDEVRFFTRGAGVFYLRINDRVHAVLCTAGDLLSVPKDTRHWFDMGSDPNFAAVRFFRIDDGWVGDFTGDEIAIRFPDFDELAGSPQSQ